MASIINRALKEDFPIFRNNKNLIYFDNAATSQKPQEVIDAVTSFYEQHNAPVHRGVYTLAERATDLYESARATIAHFIGAHDDEVIITKGTTEAINFIAMSWGRKHLEEGDEVVITELEHHANILPWIRLEKLIGIVVKYVPIKEDGSLDYDAYRALVTEKTKLVSCTHTSNVLGTHVDLKIIIEHAHAHGARVLIDAAQAAGRKALAVHEMGADFLAFSSHKMFGPTGCGVLYIARHMHDEVEPYLTGGGMVYSVDYHDAVWAKPPLRYEAGTPPIAQVIGLKAAIEFIQKNISYDALKMHEAALCAQLIDGLKDIPSIRILGPLKELRTSGHMVAFVTKTMHAHDIAAYLDQYTICVRAGNHCAQLLHKKLGTESSVRVSFSAYCTEQDVQKLIFHLQQDNALHL